MTDFELLVKVKRGLSINGQYNDDTLSLKIQAVKYFMLNAGVGIQHLESPLGIAALTVGVYDLWNLSSGDVKFSEAFMLYMLPQLQAISL